MTRRKPASQAPTSPAPPCERPTATFRRVRIASLHEDAANVRRHPERNRTTVRWSLHKFGQVENLVVEAGTGRVLAGNCRLKELRGLGIKEVEVCEVDVHGAEAARLAVVLNRSAETAGWDDSLADLLRELGETAEGLGWSDHELRALCAVPEPVPDGAEDESGGLTESFRILVECDSEVEQRELLQRFEEDGIKCRAYML